MNFSDLLDEDGQGSRRLGAWLADNINNWTNIEWVNETPYGYKNNWQHKIPNYTTGDSIDPIWGLAKKYLGKPSILPAVDKQWVCRDQSTVFPNQNNKPIESNPQPNEQLAIAEALFKAYQKENSDA